MLSDTSCLGQIDNFSCRRGKRPKPSPRLSRNRRNIQSALLEEEAVISGHISLVLECFVVVSSRERNSFVTWLAVDYTRNKRKFQSPSLFIFYPRPSTSGSRETLNTPQLVALLLLEILAVGINKCPYCLTPVTPR